MEIFKLLGTIAINNSDANDAIDKTTNKAAILGKNMVSVGSSMAKAGAKMTAVVGAGAAVAGAAVAKFANNAASTADNIDKMSQKIGVSRTAFQELDFICSQSGTSVDGLQMGLKTLTGQMDKVSEGNKAATAIFKELGIEVQNADGSFRSQEEVMWETMTALQGMEDQTQKARFATELFGRSGSELMPLLNGAAGSIEEMKQQAHDLGLIMSDESVDAGVKYTDTIDQLKRSFSAVVAESGAKLLPALTTLAQLLIEKGVPAFTKIIETITSVVEWFANLDSGTQKVILIIGAVIAASGPLITVIGTLITLGGALATVIGAISAPVLIVIGVIAALVSIGVVLYKNWDTIKEKCIELASIVYEKFMDMKEKAIGVFQNLKEKIHEIFVDGIWGTIKSVVNWVLGGIEKMCNGVIGSINVILGGIDKVVSGVGSLIGLNWNVPTLSEISLPRLEKGGVLEKGQIGFLEGNGAEAVVPLDQNKKWISRVSNEMQSQGIGGDKDYTNAMLDTMVKILEAIQGLNASEIIQIVPDEKGIFEIVKKQSKINAALGKPGIVV